MNVTLRVPTLPIPPSAVVAVLALAVAIAALITVTSVPNHPAGTAGADALAPDRAFANLPLAFERNQGQAPRSFDFLARTTTGSFMLSSSGATVRLAGGDDRRAELRLAMTGAAPAAPAALEPLPGRVNYLVGNDPARWRTDVPTFARVRYGDVWPGVDVEWYGNGRSFEYDFRVAAGADPSAIGVRVEGARGIRVAADGSLVISTPAGSVRQEAPRAFQRIDGNRVAVPSAYEVSGNRIGISVGSYDSTRPLVIDPVVLLYSTYLGGSGYDVGEGIAVDASGAAYVTGTTDSSDFDVKGPIEGADDQYDVFVTKLTPTGDALAYSTYLGGSQFDQAGAIAVDATGAAYVTGQTGSTDFNTVNPYEGKTEDGALDVFVSKLTPAGNALAYSTYVGGSTNDYGAGIAVDSDGAAYVTGTATSPDFDLVNEYEGDSPSHDVFVFKLSPAGNELAYSTYVGGNQNDQGEAIALDSSRNAYVAGWTGSTDFDTVNGYEGDGGDNQNDAFAFKLAASGNSLVYSTYLGGSAGDYASAIAVDSSGAAYIAGSTESTNFDVVGPYETDPGDLTTDAFVSKLAPTGDKLRYSTYLGGNDFDRATGIAVDASGAAYVVGATDSTDFDTVEAHETDAGSTDAFVSKLSPVGNALAYSTYLGGSSGDEAAAVALDRQGAAYVTGFTASPDFDTVRPYERDAGDTDAFVTRLLPGVRCGREFGTIVGTPGRDVIRGTPGRDVIVAGNGNDLIRSLGGNDLVCAGGGRDQVLGGPGHDRLVGGGGKDRLNGGGGRDTLAGGGQGDILRGKGGRDKLKGGAGKDRLKGGGGKDFLKGGGGKDRLSGGPKRDRCNGGPKRDRAVSCEVQRRI